MSRGTIPGVSAAVLAGGASRRMGADKAQLELAGQPLLGRVVNVLREIADEVFIVGDRAPYHQLGVPVVADAYPGAGALGGIATTLRHAREPFTLIVACDMPLLSVELLRAMARLDRDYDVLVPVTAGERSAQGGTLTYETLHAIYSRACLPAIERRLRRGELQVAGFFDEVAVRTLDRDWVRQLDPDERSMLNANDRAELEQARRIVGSQAAVAEQMGG